MVSLLSAVIGFVAVAAVALPTAASTCPLVARTAPTVTSSSSVYAVGTFETAAPIADSVRWRQDLAALMCAPADTFDLRLLTRRDVAVPCTASSAIAASGGSGSRSGGGCTARVAVVRIENKCPLFNRTCLDRPFAFLDHTFRTDPSGLTPSMHSVSIALQHSTSACARVRTHPVTVVGSDVALRIQTSSPVPPAQFEAWQDTFAAAICAMRSELDVSKSAVGGGGADAIVVGMNCSSAFLCQSLLRSFNYAVDKRQDLPSSLDVSSIVYVNAGAGSGSRGGNTGGGDLGGAAGGLPTGMNGDASGSDKPSAVIIIGAVAAVIAVAAAAGGAAFFLVYVRKKRAAPGDAHADVEMRPARLNPAAPSPALDGHGFTSVVKPQRAVGGYAGYRIADEIQAHQSGDDAPVSNGGEAMAPVLHETAVPIPQP